jgi:hypothetical protein
VTRLIMRRDLVVELDYGQFHLSTVEVEAELVQG